MSENGPYNQPPQNPYGGGDNSGGQPPYGQPQGAPYGGDPNTGGQPGYGGPGPGPGPAFPGGPVGPGGPEQQMYAGGQPPYGGGPGGPGYPPHQPQQPQGGGSKAGLWVVIGGGVVIFVLVIAVVIMLVTNSSSGNQVAADPTDAATSSQEEPAPDESDEPAPEPDTDATPAGEAPYAVPTEPCNAFTDQVISDFLIQDDGDKSVREETSSCSTLDASPPEGNAPDGYATFDVVYSVPYSATDSVEAATSDFQTAVQDVTGETDYTMYDAESIEANKEIDLGSEALLVTTRYDFLGDYIPAAVLLIRTENLNIKIEYQAQPSFSGDEAPEDLVLPDNIEDIMVNAGADALALVGT